MLGKKPATIAPRAALIDTPNTITLSRVIPQPFVPCKRTEHCYWRIANTSPFLGCHHWSPRPPTVLQHPRVRSRCLLRLSHSRTPSYLPCRHRSCSCVFTVWFVGMDLVACVQWRMSINTITSQNISCAYMPSKQDTKRDNN